MEGFKRFDSAIFEQEGVDKVEFYQNIKNMFTYRSWTFNNFNKFIKDICNVEQWFSDNKDLAEYKIPANTHVVYFTSDKNPNSWKELYINKYLKTNERLNKADSNFVHYIWTNNPGSIPEQVKSSAGVIVKDLNEFKDHPLIPNLEDLLNKGQTNWKFFVEASDVMRIISQQKYGGIYHDLDYEVFKAKPLVKMMELLSFFAGTEEEGRSDSFIGNAFIASAPNHPVINEMVGIVKRNLNFEEGVPKYIVMPYNKFDSVICSTGPMALTIAYAKAKANNDINDDMIFPPSVLYSVDYARKETARHMIGNPPAHSIGGDMFSGSWDGGGYEKAIDYNFASAMQNNNNILFESFLGAIKNPNDIIDQIKDVNKESEYYKKSIEKVKSLISDAANTDIDILINLYKQKSIPEVSTLVEIRLDELLPLVTAPYDLIRLYKLFPTKVTIPEEFNVENYEELMKMQPLDAALYALELGHVEIITDKLMEELFYKDIKEIILKALELDHVEIITDKLIERIHDNHYTGDIVLEALKKGYLDKLLKTTLFSGDEIKNLIAVGKIFAKDGHQDSFINYLRSFSDLDDGLAKFNIIYKSLPSNLNEDTKLSFLIKFFEKISFNKLEFESNLLAVLNSFKGEEYVQQIIKGKSLDIVNEFMTDIDPNNIPLLNKIEIDNSDITSLIKSNMNDNKMHEVGSILNPNKPEYYNKNVEQVKANIEHQSKIEQTLKLNSDELKTIQIDKFNKLSKSFEDTLNNYQQNRVNEAFQIKTEEMLKVNSDESKLIPITYLNGILKQNNFWDLCSQYEQHVKEGASSFSIFTELNPHGGDNKITGKHSDIFQPEEYL